MKQALSIIFCFISFTTLGQSNCAVGLIENSNDIYYNKTEIEKIINLARYDAYFFGESHNIHFEPEFKYEFIKHLNEENSVREIFMEIGQSAAHMFNRYLQTGDTTILYDNELVYVSGHYKMFWKKLYELNKHLSTNSKLHINGVDFERRELFYLIENLIQPNVHIPSYLKQTFVDINNVINDKKLTFRDPKFKKQVKKLRVAFKKYEGDFRRIYKNDFEVLCKAVNNKTPFTSFVNPRNKEWYKTMQETIQGRKIQKFVCFFGLSHTTYSNPTSLTIKLKNSHFFKGNILNLTTMYHHYVVASVDNKIFEYNYKEKGFFEKYYNPNCRAVILDSTFITDKTFKTNSDFVLLAKDVNDK